MAEMRQEQKERAFELQQAAHHSHSAPHHAHFSFLGTFAERSSMNLMFLAVAIMGVIAAAYYMLKKNEKKVEVRQSNADVEGYSTASYTLLRQ